MSQRILCPTDLTVNSKTGLLTGSRWLKNRAQLIIFHATLFPV